MSSSSLYSGPHDAHMLSPPLPSPLVTSPAWTTKPSSMRWTEQSLYRSGGCGDRFDMSDCESVRSARKFVVVFDSPGEVESERDSRGSRREGGGEKDEHVRVICQASGQLSSMDGGIAVHSRLLPPDILPPMSPVLPHPALRARWPDHTKLRSHAAMTASCQTQLARNHMRLGLLTRTGQNTCSSLPSFSVLEGQRSPGNTSLPWAPA